MINKYLNSIFLLLVLSFNIEASQLLNTNKRIPSDKTQEFASVDEYMQYRFKTLEQFGMPEKEIQSMKDSYELYKIELISNQLEDKNLPQDIANKMGHKDRSRN